jgi:hypothetical protein
MNNNLYWTVYKNLERELIELSNLVHIDDKQLEIYSIKITELLIRTVVEVESISKELYFQNGGLKQNNKDLFFDTDCLDLLENKWLLSKKQVQISAPNFYFNLVENRILTPLNKANKRGTSSSDWLKAYQAVKHNRAQSLAKGNLKHLIRALAGLYVLNLYYKDNLYDLGKDETGTNFDNSFGSSIFSTKTHKNNTISIDSEYTKNLDFDECIYIIKSTDKTRAEVQNSLKIVNDKINERATSILLQEIQKRFSGIQNQNQEQIQEEIKATFEKIKSDNMVTVAKENGHLLKKAFDELKYEAILNKQQY